MLTAVAGGIAASVPSSVPALAGSRAEEALDHPAPGFSLPARDGGTVVLDSLRGKPVLVDFWASWCVPCKDSFPWMRAIREQYGPKGLRIVAVNLDKKRDAAEAFLAKYPAPFTVVFDPSGKTAEAFHVAVMPTTFLVGTDGRVLLVHPGFDPGKTGPLEAKIREVCAP